MEELNYFIILSIILISALFVGKLTHWMKITAVVGYLITGVILGPEVTKIVHLNSEVMSMIIWFALGFVGFIIGGKLSLPQLRRNGKQIILIMLGGMIVPFIFVLLGIYLLKGSLTLGLIFGALATTSAPAGTIAVIYEYRARGKLTDGIIAVVGLDDAFGILVFAVTMAIVTAITAGSNSIMSIETLWPAVKEIGGSILLGSVLGFVLTFIAKLVHERIELFAITMALLIGGIGVSIYFEFSVILTCIIMGLILVNRLPNESRIIFRDLNQLTLVIFIVFFVTAGMELKINVLTGSGMLVLVYVLFRTAGKLSGPMFGAKLSKADKVLERYLGFGILPQAGVALGLALLASNKLSSTNPEMAGWIITTITATTIIFEIIGPIGARFALIRSGEANCDINKDLSCD